MTFDIPTTLTVTYSVDKCTHARFNGEHTEEFDLSKLTSEDIKQYLAQTLIIKRQNQLRSKSAINADTGEVKLILGTWSVPEPGKKIATSSMEKAATMLGKLSKEQIRALLLAQLDEQDNEEETDEV